MFEYGIGRNAIICMIIWVVMAIVFMAVCCYDDYKDKKKVSKSSIITAIALVVLSGIIFVFIAFLFQNDYAKVSKIEAVLEKNYSGYTDFKYTDQPDYSLTIEDDTTHLIKSDADDDEPSSFIYKSQKYYICDSTTRNDKNLLIVFKDGGKKSTVVAVFVDGEKQKSLSIKNIYKGLTVNKQGQFEYRE